jgi:hypothetical protein
MNRMMKALLGIGALGGAALAGVFGYALYQGPRMKEQPHLRTYQWQMALPPPEAVPVDPAGTAVSGSGGVGKGAADRGAVYYTYYCLSCHGKDGRGHGPVGESYDVVPRDLTKLDLAPAALQTAMLTGPGHSPVLERVVRPEYRRDLVAYLQRLSSGKGEVSRGR